MKLRVEIAHSYRKQPSTVRKIVRCLLAPRREWLSEGERSKSGIFRTFLSQSTLARVFSANAFLSLTILLVLFDAYLQASWKDDIGYTQLSSELGVTISPEIGIAVSLVEANTADAGYGGQRYSPNLTNSEFSGKLIVDQTGTSTGVSNHADRVGELFFGHTESIAPQVNHVDVYEANNYVDHILNFLSGDDPLPQSTSVQNHSWMSGGTELTVGNVLERFDYAIDQNDITAVVALGNGSGDVPHILAHAFNSITVGRSDGMHTFGTTNLESYGQGRTKPEIVAPLSSSSFATAAVSSSAAFLQIAADGSDAMKVEPMKAILLAGATKDDVESWSRTDQQPLDETFGAGQLNVYNSFHILMSGEKQASDVPPTDSAGGDGWDYVPSIQADSQLYYNVHVPTAGAKLSAILAWNVNISDKDLSGRFNSARDLANLDLSLFDSSQTFLGSLVDLSSSDESNVEHIYQRELPAGLYTLEVTTDQSQDFGIAWRLETAPEPHGDLLFACAMVLILARRRPGSN